MLALLRDPIPPLRLAALSLGLALAVALYCMVYSGLSGRTESFGQSSVWALVNVLPWIPALEGTKRASGAIGVAAALAAGLVASLALGFALGSASGPVDFEAWRRVPALAAVAAIALMLRWTDRKAANATSEIPLLPHQIDWVRAARNYVELRARQRTVVVRASLSEVERQLSGHGFVRIHRSMLVRRECIARVRPDDVVLADGTHLKIGKRYRSALAA